MPNPYDYQQGMLPLPAQATQEPMPPMQSPGPSLPEILATIGGLGLNIGGIATGAGAVGNSSLGLAQQLAQQAQQQQYYDYKNQTKQAEIQRAREISDQFRPRLNEIRDSKSRDVVGKYFDQGDDKGGISEFYRVLGDQQQADAKRDREDTGFKWIDAKLADVYKEEDKNQKELTAKLPGSAREREFQQIFFQGLPKMPESAEQLMVAYNQNPQSPKKISLTEATALFEMAEEHYSSDKLSDKRGNVRQLWEYLPDFVPGAGESRTMADSFANFYEKNVHPDDHQKYVDGLKELAVSQAKQDEVRGIRNKFAVPSSRKDGAAEAERFFGGGAPGGTSPEMVKVVDKDGKPFMLPKANLGKAMKRGYKLAK